MVPKGWRERSISEILNRVSKPVEVEPNSLYKEIGIRSHGKGIFHKELILGKSLGNKRVFHIKPNCFVVNIVFAWEQAIAKTTGDEVGMIASHRFPMYEPKNGECDVEYILYFFKTKKGKHLLELASPGGAGRNKTLGQNEFSKIKLQIPPLAEQKKIAKILSTWDKAISTTEQLLTNSQQQKKALMQQLLTGKKRFPGFTYEWEDRYLTEMAKVIVSPVDKKTIENEVPVLLCNYTDVYYNSRITKALKFMKATAKKSEIDKYTLKEGDVIITKDSETPGDIAVPALVSEPLEGVLCGYHLAIIRPVPQILHGAFISYLFSIPQTRYYFFTLATGATRFGLSVAGINKAHFKIPPPKEQQKIATVLSTADNEIENLQNQLEYLKQEKKALMQQLLTGKRRVKVNQSEVINV